MQDIIKKLKFKDKGIIINAPADIENEFVKLGFTTAFEKNTKSTNTLVFINNNKEYVSFLEKNLKKVEPDSLLWIAYPKGTSKVKTDVNRDTIRTSCEAYGIATVAAISIDDTWSALRFRPVEKVGK